MTRPSADFCQDNHPPHRWPVGTPDGWRQGYGCPTVRCKGEGEQRDDDASNGPRPELTVDDLLDAIETAEAQALARHEAGVCALSEWSCSYCEAENA